MFLGDALAWTGTPSIFSAAVALAMMLVFFFGFPFIFLGVLAVLIGFTIRLLWGRSAGLALLISGALIIGVGVLTIVLPQMLVPAGSGDIAMAWMSGLTALLVGIPLPLLGAVLFVVGLAKTIKQLVTTF
jgi:hypothetical protein